MQIGKLLVFYIFNSRLRWRYAGSAIVFTHLGIALPLKDKESHYNKERVTVLNQSTMMRTELHVQ